MSKFVDYIGLQFGNPRGFIGKICCFCMNIVNKKMYMKVVSQLSKEKTILEIGYGNGFMTKKIYNKTKAKIAGIDISKDMQKTASKRNAKGIKAGDIKLKLGDCCDLKYDDYSFDAVVTVNTIYFWNDTIKGLEEIRRVLRDGGKFYNVVYSKEWMSRSDAMKAGKKMFTREEYISLAKEAGFSKVKIKDIKQGVNFMIVCKK